MPSFDSNFPPGITGNEYEIAGPDWAEHSVFYCEECAADTRQVIEGFWGSVWATCDECGEETEKDLE